MKLPPSAAGPSPVPVRLASPSDLVTQMQRLDHRKVAHHRLRRCGTPLPCTPSSPARLPRLARPASPSKHNLSGTSLKWVASSFGAGCCASARQVQGGVAELPHPRGVYRVSVAAVFDGRTRDNHHHCRCCCCCCCCRHHLPSRFCVYLASLHARDGLPLDSMVRKSLGCSRCSRRKQPFDACIPELSEAPHRPVGVPPARRQHQDLAGRHSFVARELREAVPLRVPPDVNHRDDSAMIRQCQNQRGREQMPLMRGVKGIRFSQSRNPFESDGISVVMNVLTHVRVRRMKQQGSLEFNAHSIPFKSIETAAVRSRDQVRLLSCGSGNIIFTN